MYTYPKNEKLKSKKHLQKLFSEGIMLVNHPLRMVFVPIDKASVGVEVGVSVSKRTYKRAVDRNYYKRLLREAYRKNQHLLKDTLPQSYAIMFFYQSRSKYDLATIEVKMCELFEKFAEKVSK